AWLALGALTGVRATVWSRADALWTEATRRSPGSARAHWNLGSALDRRGDLQGALASFSRAEEVEAARGDPPDPLLQQNVASVLRRSGRAAEARRVIERALARDGSNAGLHDDLAILLLEAGDPEPAAVHAREAIRLAPGHAPFWETLAEVARDRGDPRGQVTALRRAAELDPRFPERDAELAELEARLGNAPGACAAWDRVLRWSAAGPVRARAVQRRGALRCGDADPGPAL
ncbi:MAG: tetratricopeptide repeat protein, partial [Anaeromyxobacteraceae bacterium]